MLHNLQMNTKTMSIIADVIFGTSSSSSCGIACYSSPNRTTILFTRVVTQKYVRNKAEWIFKGRGTTPTREEETVIILNTFTRNWNWSSWM